MKIKLLIGFTFGCCCRRFINYNFTTIVELSFYPMRTVAQVRFAGCGIYAPCFCCCFVVGPTFSASLLGVSSFRIRHFTLFIGLLIIVSLYRYTRLLLLAFGLFLIVFFELLQSFPQRVLYRFFVLFGQLFEQLQGLRVAA